MSGLFYIFFNPDVSLFQDSSLFLYIKSGLPILIGPYPLEIKNSEHDEDLLSGTIKETLDPRTND